MDFTVENICGLIIRSRLLTPEVAKSLYQRWLDEAKGHADSVTHFGSWLVVQQYVTDYQATLLLKGHADGFFLGQYQILDRLGKGRMAGVYKAIHHLGQLVAIKVLPPSKARDPLMLGRFQREARLSLRLKHPHVVRSFQVGATNGLHYLVMEYLEGETLDEVLGRRTKLPPAEGVRLIHQALLGLQHLHEQGMVHRDLKPANLMLVPPPGRNHADTTRSTVKILDIGLGREMFDENAPPPEQNVELTGEGVLLGTPDYLAPEQARDPRSIDIRADIYSLGCVLYHTLTGQPPFPDKNILTQMIRHASEAPRPLREFNAAIPDGLQQILNWMMAKAPEQRYPTPERAAKALEVFLVAEGDAAEAVDDEPQLREFLTWLETDGKGPAPGESPPVPVAAVATVATIPVAMPAVPASASNPVAVVATSAQGATAAVGNFPVGRPARPPATAPAEPRERRKPRGDRAGPRPASAPRPTPLEVDVELVPVDVPGGPSSRAGMSGRDWMLLGIGAGAVILAGLLGMILAFVLS